ncbi:MAG: ParB/RepB/Spo0J family partition protein [Actinomycetota bacterium]
MSIVTVPLTNLEPDPFQPRKEFNDTSIRELAGSIERHGLLQPLIVRPRQGPNSAGKYWIVAGERRFRAAHLLGLQGLPCRVQPYLNLTAAVTALVENVHREDLSDVDKAEGMKRIKSMTDKTWEEVAELVKLSPEYVRRLAGLLKLEESVKTMVRQGRISARTAIALKPLPPRQQVEMAERVLSEGLTAEDIRDEVRKSSLPGSTRTTAKPPAPISKPEIALELLAGRGGSVTQTLEVFTQELEGMIDWLDDRTWTPSKLTERQKELIHALYHTASQLQQRVAQVRQPLKVDERLAAKAGTDLFPF